jgi:Uma2 family endonuclease
MSLLTTRPPRLESGDRLTRAEFHRRYLAWPKKGKAELVEGVVYVTSPVSALHGEPHARVVGWLFAYQAKHPDLRLHDNVTVYLDADNEVQPDACLWREEPGGPRLNERGYIEGAPQLVVEIAISSASYDLHAKRRAYRRNGVREYVVWRT